MGIAAAITKHLLWSADAGREDDVEGVRGEDSRHATLDPSRLREALAFWAMPIAARVVGDRAEPALVAHVGVSAQRRGPATRDGAQDLVLIRREDVRAHEGL